MIIGNCPVCGAEMRAGTDMTNADRIRAMTDEELAEWIYQVQDGDAYQKENYLPPLSKSWWLKWLKQEADHA